MGYNYIMKTIGFVVLLAGIYYGGRFYFSYSFYKKLEKFINRDLTNNDVKYICNEVSKYEIGKLSTNWDILMKTIIQVELSTAEEDVKDNFYRICNEIGVDVKKVLEEYEL